MRSWSKKAILPAVAVVFLIIAGLWYLRASAAQTTVFRTAAVQRGDLLITISATGTLQPEEVIDVGAQVAGQIVAFGLDTEGKPVDYGSCVKEGGVLAQIDDAVYKAEVAQAQAQVQAGQAGVSRAVADLTQLKAKLQQAERDWQRAQKLGPSEALAQATFDAYESAYETAKANVAVGEAAILQAQAELARAQGALWRAERNLGYCVITSPVDGIIIDRRVNIGQTVVASLNAPSLFLIAKDLRRMQLWVAVNEADIGRIHPGQQVTFTVDAFPGQDFRGQVRKVRLNASMTQNVVTYTVEIATDNSRGILLPYLTANVQFHVDQRQDVWLVPNAALRFTPTDQQIDPVARQVTADASASSAPATAPDERPATLWVAQGSYVRPLSVTAGLSDGIFTEVRGEALRQDLVVVTGVQTVQASVSSDADTTNPFAPKLPSRRNRPPGPPPG